MFKKKNNKITEDFTEKLLQELSQENKGKTISSIKMARIRNKYEHYYNELTHKPMKEANQWLKNLAYLFSGAVIAIFAIFMFNYFQVQNSGLMQLSSSSMDFMDTSVDSVKSFNETDNKVYNLGASVAYLEGKLEKKNNNDWIELKVGDDIEVGDILKTSVDGRAIINFDDGSSARLDANTEIEVKTMNNKEILLVQDSGQVYSRVHKSTKLAYSVKALDTKITAMGTAFTVNRNHADTVIVKVLESKVKVENKKENKVENVEAGEKVIVQEKEEKVVLEKKNLDYKELQDDFYQWNSELDLQNKEPLGVLAEVPPKLEILNIKDGLLTYQKGIKIKGKTDKNAQVFINGYEVSNNEGYFEKYINLNIGENKIEVTALNELNKKSIKTIKVIRKEEKVQNKTRSIYLKAKVNGNKVYLNWSLNNMESPKGFKVVYNKTGNPVYPGDTYHYKSDPNTRSDSWTLSPGTYYFRVCEYLGGKCGVYSNQVKVVISGESANNNVNGSIYLKAKVDGEKVYLNWSLNNMESPKGFKVVYNKTGNPVYPGDTYHYKSDPNTRSDSWTLSPGTYYFRVCEYLGGKCGVYSNQVKVIVE